MFGPFAIKIDDKNHYEIQKYLISKNIFYLGEKNYTEPEDLYISKYFKDSYFIIYPDEHIYRLSYLKYMIGDWSDQIYDLETFKFILEYPTAYKFGLI
jgi:hypothetical protein